MVGIVASRMVERHHRPVVVISLDGEGGGRGSGRSIPGFDLLAALEACSSTWPASAGTGPRRGWSCEAENLDAFREAFAAHAGERARPRGPERTERIDAMVGGAALGLDLAEELRRLAPFGMGNPGVRLLVPSAQVRDVRTMGEGKHARFSLHSGAHRALGVSFGRPSLGSARTIWSMSPCGSRSTTGTARSSRRSSCASCTRANGREASAARQARSGGSASRPSSREGSRAAGQSSTDAADYGGTSAAS